MKSSEAQRWIIDHALKTKQSSVVGDGQYNEGELKFWPDNNI